MRKRQYHHGDLKNALIRAGAEILATEGAAGLTLRKAALRAGVSHSAPYAHFADKQALVAAISTEGLRTLLARIDAANAPHRDDPLLRLAGAAWETVRFALEQPDQYRVTFSKVLEQESDYPDYVAVAHGSFDALVALVQECQAAGVVAPGPADVAAVGLWSLVHGFATLLVNQQFPSGLLARTSARELLLRSLASYLEAPALEALAAAAPSSGKRQDAGRKPARVTRRPAR